MKILITENQLKSLIKNIINEQDNNRTLELLKKKGPMDEWFYENIVKNVEKKVYQYYYPDEIFYVDKNTDFIYMKYDQKNKKLYVNYNKILLYFYHNYSSNVREVRELINFLMGEYYDLWQIRIIDYYGRKGI